SVASVHRFCKKLGLEGFKDLKVELIRLTTEAGNRRDVDINFPFDATSTPAQVMERMEGLYQTTLAETQELLDPAQLDYAAKLIANARQVDIFTGSHNLYPAGMFRDRLLSAGKSTTCYGGVEAQVRTALLASGPEHVAIVISYSGLAPNLREILPILSSRHVPVIVIGTPYCARIHPGFAAYLMVSDHESMTHRITQFASHIAVQYVLDSLYSSYFAKDYARCSEFLERSFPYTRLPGLK
ncbi:MAG: MurR/RpiR family transcriptional regulator, partial [Collinsella sp.]|nr:MurR/RpiR family transcriptional regulator [Collinsella sp.]